MAFAGAVWGDDRFSDRIGGACFIWPERGVHVSLPGRFPAIFTKGGPIPAGGADRTNGEGNHTYLRFWRAVQGADRPARPGGGGLFRDPPLYRKPGGDPDHGPGGDYFYRRAGQRLSPWLSRLQPGNSGAGDPRSGHLLRDAAALFHVRRPVGPCETREYGVVEAWLEDSCPLFLGNPGPVPVLMSHTDQVLELPEGFSPAAHTWHCPVAAFAAPDRKLWGVQFHPEVEQTRDGPEILRRFLYGICGCRGGYSMENYLESCLDEIREQVGDARVLLGLSGGVDSSVCAALLARAVRAS